MEEKDMHQTLNADERNQLELYRAFGLGGVCTIRVDEDLTLLYANDLFYQLHGYKQEELQGKSSAILIHPDDLFYFKQLLKSAIENKEMLLEWEMRVLTKDGVQKNVLTSGKIRSCGHEYVLDGYVLDVSRQKQTEEALKQSEEKFRIAMENSDISVWTYRYERKAIQNIAASRKRYGTNLNITNVPESLIADGYVRSDSVAAFREMYQKLTDGAPTASGDFWFRSPSGSGWWCEHIDYTNIFNEKGKPVYAYAVDKDVTAAKNAERKYEEEIAYQKATESSSLLAKVRADVTRNTVEDYLFKNENRIQDNGLSYTECIQKLADSCVTEEEKNHLKKHLNRAHVLEAFEQGDTAFSYDYRRKLDDGSVIWVNTAVKTYRNPNSENVMAFIYSYDINDRMIKDGIISAITSLEYDYISYIDLKNDVYRIFMGKENHVGSIIPKQAESYTESVYEVNRKVVVPKDAERAIADMLPEGIEKNLKEQRVFSTVYSVYEDDSHQKIRQKRMQYAYLDEAAGRVVLTRTDVTEILQQQKLQQEALETALLAAKQASSAKSDFLSRMSHEIRTPMNAIIGMTAIAAQSIGDDRQVADCISKIGISSRFLLSLINDILDMSRIESGKMLLKNEEFPFEEFISGINSICYPQARGKNIDYECTVSPNTEEYYVGDAMKLQQVLVNIMANAVKFTPEGGRVSMNVRQKSRNSNHAVLSFTINDTGCGISEEFLPHMFEPFAQENTSTTTVYGGTGLGLAICKNLVDMMNGQIHVRSIVGVGSEFTVEVSLGISEKTRERHTGVSAFQYSSLKTLVVDDDVTVCEYTEMILKEMNMHSEWAASGKKAIELVRKRSEEKKTFDLIILDWKMPDMDGIETAREIRKIAGPDVTIIIMTAYDWASIEQEAKLAGVNLLISKPMFKSSLISAFDTVYQSRQNKASEEKAEEYDFTGKRVLLAEDHPLNVEVAVKLLEHKGFQVETAENGLRALERFTETPVGYYDAILMDIRMPLMDGLQAANNIRHCQKKDAKTIPIIAMTANAFEDDIEKSKAAGMNAHLAKPIEPDLLYRTLAEWIEKSGKTE